MHGLLGPYSADKRKEARLVLRHTYCMVGGAALPEVWGEVAYSLLHTWERKQLVYQQETEF